jgi:osmoprotectant transport system substrate-binding protein
MKPTKLVLAGAIISSALALTACGGGDPLAEESAKPVSSDTIAIGSADFPESTLLAEIFAGALEAKGVKVTKRLNIGSREVYLPALKDGSIDMVPEYTGVLLQYFDKDAKQQFSPEVYAALKTKVPSGLEVLDQASAEDKDAVVVTAETAAQYKLSSIADLKPVADKLVLGGPSEWKTRPTGVPGLKKKYDLTFKSFKSLDAGGPLTIDALKKGQVQAANVFSTDPNISANGWKVLSDPEGLFAAQNIVPLIRTSKATDTVKTTVNQVTVMLTTPGVSALLKQVVLDKKDPATVAKEWLTTNNLG